MENNEKLAKMLKEVADSLTDAQKKKAETLKTVDELVDFLTAEGIELPDELLESVAGGLSTLSYPEFSPNGAGAKSVGTKGIGDNSTLGIGENSTKGIGDNSTKGIGENSTKGIGDNSTKSFGQNNTL